MIEFDMNSVINQFGALMKQRINVLTIGVNNIEESLKFYKDGMGLKTKGIEGAEFEHGSVVFFDLTDTLKLALYQKKDIAWDANIPLDKQSATEFTIGHNVNSKEEVDQVMNQAKHAGAKIIKEPHKTFWGGYSGYFQDPNGHLWEIVFAPNWIIKE